MQKVLGVLPLLAAVRDHYGLRIVIFVLLVAAIAVVAVLLMRRRRAGQPAHRSGASDGPPGKPPVSGAPRTGATPANVWCGGGARRQVIEVRDLTKRYGGRVAVDRLSFEVQPGHVTGFLGPNGAGKSTTMRLIMGLDIPDTGSATVGGRRYHDLAWPLYEVGALLEAGAIHPGRSAVAHLRMLARTSGIPRHRVDEVLNLVGLTSVADQRVGRFSLGMRQRLGIAVALLGDPGVLMFDEPANGLDTDGIRWVRQLLCGLASEGRTVLVSSHLMSEMALTADRVVVIGKGRLIAEMPIDEFTAQNARGYVRVRSPQLDQLRPALEAAGASVVDEGDGSMSVRGLTKEQIGEVAWDHSILLHELAPQAASLEEAFVESTEGDVEYRGDHPPVPGDRARGARP